MIRYLFFCFLSLASLQSFAALEKGLSVSGSCHKQIAPDRGSINLMATSLESSMSVATEKSAKIYETMRREIKSLNLKDLQMQTSEFSVQEEFDFVGKDRRKVSKGFRANMGLEVTTSEVQRLGEIFSVGTKNHVNDIGGLRTFLAPETLRSATQACLEQAVANARQKAELMAKAANAKLGEVISIDENPNSRGMPTPMYEAMDMAAADAPLAKAQIFPGVESKPEEVSVQIAMVIGLR